MTCGNGTAVCQRGSSRNHWDIGGVAAPVATPSGLQIVFNNGDDSSCSGVHRTSTLHLLCGRSQAMGSSLGMYLCTKCRDFFPFAITTAGPMLTYTGLPIFSGEPAVCEYSFTWVTPAACPVTSYHSASCQLVVPLWGLSVNLQALGQQTWPVDGLGDLQLSVCNGELPCGGAACLGSHVLASSSVEIEWTPTTPSSISVALGLGGACKTSTGTADNFSLGFELVCDPCATPGIQGPMLVSNDSCTYVLVWPSALACVLGQTCTSPRTTLPTTAPTATMIPGTTLTTAHAEHTTVLPPATTVLPPAAAVGSGSSHTGLIVGACVTVAVLAVVAAGVVVWRTNACGRCRSRIRYQPVVSEFYNREADDDDDMLD